MSNFWRNATIMAIAEILLKLKAVIMMPFITKYLGAVNYGIWSQVMVLVSLLSPLIFLGMDNSIARFLPGKPLEEQKQDFTGWFIFGLVSSSIILIFLTLSSSKLSKLFFGAEAKYISFVLLAGPNIVVASMLAGIRNWFRIQNKVWHLVTITIVQNLLQTLVLILVLIKHQGIYELVLWSLITDILIALGYITYLYADNVFTKPTIHWLKPYLRFGIVLLPSGYAVWVLNSLDRVFLAQYHTLADIGIYSICFTMGYTLIQVVVSPIWSLFPTKAAELFNTGNIKELNILLNQSIKLICWIVFPSVFGLIVVGDILLEVLSTQEFSNGHLVVPVILIGYLFFILSAYFEILLTLKNKPIFSTIFTCIACIANIVLNFILIPKFSYLGAAFATALSFALQLTLSATYGLKEEFISIDIHPIIKIIFASIIMFLATFLIKKGMYSSNMFSLVILSAIGFLFYIALTQALRIYKFKSLLKLFKKDFVYIERT